MTASDLVTTATCATVKALAEQLTGDDWTIDRIDVNDVNRARLRGLTAYVSYDGRGWRVVCDSKLSGRKLAHVLLHELAHVHLGHVARRVDWHWQRDRDVMGGASDAARVGALRSLADGWSDLEREKQAESWAADQLGQWWPVVMAVVRAISEGMGRVQV